MKMEQVSLDQLTPGNLFDFVEGGAHHLGMRVRGIRASTHPDGVIKLATWDRLVPAILFDARLVDGPVQRYLDPWEVIPVLETELQPGDDHPPGTFLSSRGLGECVLCEDHGRIRTFVMRSGIEASGSFRGDRSFAAWTMVFDDKLFAPPPG